MRKEELRLSQRDRDRLVVLEGIEGGHWSQREGALQLGVSPRWVRKLLGRRREEGDGGIVHRGRGRASNRRIGEQVRERVMAVVRQRYADFGPTLAAERLAEEGLWQVRKKRLRQVHVWRARRGSLGELGAEQRLEDILSVRVGRQVSNDYTVSWRATTWALGREQAQPGMRGARVEVEQRLDGSVWLRFRGSSLKLTLCPAPLAARPGGRRPEGLAASKAHTPHPNHPWRRKFLSG